MKISTRGRYAVRVLVDMAEHDAGEYIPLKEVAERQEISQKYLEGIMILLSKNKIVKTTHGKGGGYKFNIPPEKITVGDILRLTEANWAPVSCLEDNVEPCPRAADCRTRGMWGEFYKLVNNYFDNIHIADLVNKGVQNQYVI